MSSTLDRASKRASQMVPYSMVDFRGSWPVAPGMQGRPANVATTGAFNQRVMDDDENSLARFDSGDSTAKKGGFRVDEREEAEAEEQVLGSTDIYDKDGNLILVPTPTPDPRDPINLPMWRKWAAIGCLCFFGSISLAAEIAVAGLTPVFLLEYSGVDAAAILKTADMRNNPDPLSLVPAGVKPVSLSQVALLATIPMLSNGIATYFLVPLSTAVGRRPVLLLTSTLSWLSGFWAGASTSLWSHIAARVFHGLGSGAVEALIPLIIQDITFIHQRPKAFAAIFSAQGPMIVTFGILGPYISVEYTWRYVYYITSGIGIFAWILLILLVPETRKTRSKEELAGQQLWPVEPGCDRTKLDYALYGARTRADDIGMFQYGYLWREAGEQIAATFKTMFFPAILYATLLQTISGIVMGATGQVVSFALLGAGIPFELTGLSNLPQIVSTVLVFFVGGALPEKVTMWIATRKGRREPEYQLVNLFPPILMAIAGAITFGYADQFSLHYTILLLGVFLLQTAPLMSAPIINNYVIESYPQWAGPVLVNVSTLRVFTGFYFNTQVTTWISAVGPLMFMVYVSIAMLVASAGIPILFVYGKNLRKWTSGRVNKVKPAKWVEP